MTNTAIWSKGSVYGENDLDRAVDSRRIALSANGETLVVGFTDANVVRVYDKLEEGWQARAQHINGGRVVGLGETVAVSDDGNIVAVTRIRIRSTYIYEWDGGSLTFKDALGYFYHGEDGGNSISIS